MAHTAYTYQLKSVECDQCGGPVVTEASAIEATCSYCHAVLRLVVRPKDAVRERIDESARIAGLRAQVGKQDPNGPLAPRPPDGMQAFAAMLTRKDARPAAVEALRQEWVQARAAATARPSRESGTRVFRAALLLARFYAADDEDKRARALVETAINLVSEPGQRDILRFWLARAALDASDLEAFDAWIADANPQPVHLEVDSALRLTRARRATTESRWDDVMRTIGSYTGEIPMAKESETAARFVRAHAFAGRGDEVSAVREIRGALTGVDDPRELVRILLHEYPGPAADIAAEEAGPPPSAAFDATVTAPAAAAAYAVAERRASYFRGLPKLAGFLPLLLLPIFLVPILAPSCFVRSCGIGEVETLVIRSVEACPAAAAALGADLTPTSGSGCVSLKTGGGNGHVEWGFTLRGSRGRGDLSFNAVEQLGDWRLVAAKLDVNGQRIDLLACGAAASKGSGTPAGAIPSSPPGVSMQDLTDGESDPLTIGAQLLQGGCDGGDMNACYSLGLMYRTMPQLQDEAKALELIQRACDGGHSGACSALGR